MPAFSRRNARHRRRHVFGEHRKRHGPHEIESPLVDPVDIARDHRSRAARDRCGANRRVDVHIVDVHDPRARDCLGWQLAIAQLQALVPIPEHDALAGVLVDENDRILIRHVADDNVGEVDAAIFQVAPDAFRVVIRAGDADELRPQTQTRAGCQRRRDLATAGDEMPRNSHFRQRGRRRRIRGQLVDEVNRCRANPEDIEGPIDRRRGRLHWQSITGD
jgi:hypothetical protein